MSRPGVAAESLARAMLARMGFLDHRTNGDLVELANLIAWALVIRRGNYSTAIRLDATDRRNFDRFYQICDLIEYAE